MVSIKTSSDVFSNANEMVKKIDGAGVNYVTEIMMTYNPNKFANLNKQQTKKYNTIEFRIILP